MKLTKAQLDFVATDNQARELVIFSEALCDAACLMRRREQTKDAVLVEKKVRSIHKELRKIFKDQGI